MIKCDDSYLVVRFCGSQQNHFIPGVDQRPSIPFQFLVSWNIHQHHLVRDTDYIAVHTEGNWYFYFILYNYMEYSYIKIQNLEGCGCFPSCHSLCGIVRENFLGKNNNKLRAVSSTRYRGCDSFAIEIAQVVRHLWMFYLEVVQCLDERTGNYI